MGTLTDEKRIGLEEKANQIRVSIIESLLEAGSGHTAGPLDMADVFTALYFNIMNINPKNPWEENNSPAKMIKRNLFDS